MKILFVPDIPNWAIGGLVNAKVKYLQHHDCKIVPVHPRDAISRADEFLKIVQDFEPDIICYEYFRSASQLIQTKPELKQYKSILVHHNQRDKALYHADWNELGINTIVTHTNKCREKLEKKGYFNVETINHGIDLDFFSYYGKEPEDPTIGYVGRVCPWKGLREIAEVSKELKDEKGLDYPVMMMGKIDKADYWATVPQERLRFDFMDCPNEERANAYKAMTIYVGNSEDDYEEGTLPFLEALATGVPVITTLNGVARDIIKDEYNALVVDFKDKEGLKTQIERLMGDKELRAKLRKNGWNTVKNMTERKMAWEYSKLFNKVMYKQDLVSVIIPTTFDRLEETKNILTALENQAHQAIEPIIVWDEEILGDVDKKYILKSYKLSVKNLFTNKQGYNLAMARNIGAIEAEGKYLMFCDSRLKPDKEAIETFVQSHSNMEAGRIWYFGDKGSQKQSFVENFSFISKADFVRFGFFLERIDKYGGMSQEVRTRWIKQGGTFLYIDNAKAEQIKSSSQNSKRKKDIIDMKFRLLQIYEGENH